MSGQFWTVAELHEPSVEDLNEFHDELSQAINKAFKRSDCRPTLTIAVRNNSGRVAMIFINGTRYTPTK